MSIEPRPFTFNEKFALAVFALFCPVYLGLAQTIGPDSALGADYASSGLGWVLAWGTLALLAFCTVAATVFFSPAFHPSPLRMHIGRFLPLLALGLGLWASAVASYALSASHQRSFARLHARDLAGLPPRAVIYRKGVPDGGTAIVRSPDRDPVSLPQAVMVRLTGERFQSCRRISKIDWACRFD